MRRSIKWFVAAMAACAMLAGCTANNNSVNDDGATAGPMPEKKGQLRLLVGSEIKDLVPILDKAEDEIGVEVALEYSGTLQGAEKVAAMPADNPTFEGVWFSSNRYMSLVEDAQNQVAVSESIMYSPVLMGVKASKAQELGWDTTKPSWADIAAASREGKLTYGMTDPSASNTGFSALVAVATALAGGGAALDAERSAQVREPLTGFFAGQQLTSGSSGWLADAYVEGVQNGHGVDGMINYESVLMDVNADAGLPEQLVPIYPSDGVVTADYPLTLLTSADDEKRELYDRLIEWLLTPEIQQEIMESTARRPVDQSVQLQDRFSKDLLVELPFPGQRSVVDSLISAYLSDYRNPAHVFFVLDVSGSMEEQNRLVDLKSAVSQLAASGGENTMDTFSAFRNREKVTILTFNQTTSEIGEYTIEGDVNANDPGRTRILSDVQKLTANGDTAMYDALSLAYTKAVESKDASAATGENRLVSIVLLTDGEQTAGKSFTQFEQEWATMPETSRTIRTFTVLFGESDDAEAQQVADMTQGRVFDARTDGLAAVFREIRGYQ